MKTALRGPRPDTALRRLYTRRQLRPGRVLAQRAAAAALLCIAVLAIFWLDSDGLKDQIDGHISFADIVYFTMVTISTVGYGDIVPVSDRARLIDALLVTPLRLLIWLIFLGTAYELVIQRWIEGWRMRRLQAQLNQHVIVCGFGHSGQSAARELAARGVAPGCILVIDHAEAALELAAEQGFIGYRGDSTHDPDLLHAGIERAASVLICLGRDDTAVLSILTIRQYNPSVRIVCNVKADENIALTRQAGANVVVSPATVGGILMADAVHTRHVADYVLDLMSTGGRLRIRERLARPDEVGKSMRELESSMVARLIREGRAVSFWEGDAARIRAGDTLLLIEQDEPAQKDA